MTPERWKRVEEIFLEAVELSPGQRDAWLDQACDGDSELRDEVTSLLASDGEVSETFVGGKVHNAVVSFSQKSSEGARVGPYELIREIGRGGMGTVFLARRADDQYQNEVAVKLVRPGMDTDFILSRFRRERQILANLDHPNIAKLLDGGTTSDGLPYIVMEYIRGLKINDYCKSAQLSLEKRLLMFLDVCSAVDHAHRHFVVHRDLKPGNILIDERGAPKLLDFGICKLLYGNPMAPEETMTQGVGLMTPDYASPEQVLGDPVTVVSDVYSLGAVLYEILTGVRAHKIENYTPQQVERAICEQAVVRPSLAAQDKVMAKALHGDLDTILLKALQKEPARRYVSADHLAEDIRRHLQFRPVVARPDSLGYRTRKFIRRNRREVIAGALIVLALAGGQIEARRQASFAYKNLRQVQQIANAFVFEVHDSIKDLPGATKARELVVQRGAEHLDRLALAIGDDPDLNSQLAAAYRRLGDVQGGVLASNKGNTKQALLSYQKALKLLDKPASQSVEANVIRVSLHRLIGDIEIYTVGAPRAIETYRQGIRIGEELFAKNPRNRELRVEMAGILTTLGRALRLRDDNDASARAGLQAVKVLEDLVAEEPAEPSSRRALASALSATGMVQARIGQLQEGLVNHRKGLEHLQWLSSLDPLNVSTKREIMLAYSHIGDVLGNPSLPNLGDSEGALTAYREMVRIATELYEADKSDARAMGDYGISLFRLAVATPQGRPERLALFRKSMDVMDEASRQNPSNQMMHMNREYVADQIGDIYAAANDRAAALRWWRRSVDIGAPLVSSKLTSVLKSLVITYRKLAEDAAHHGRREEALALVSKMMALGEMATADQKDKTVMGALGLLPRAYAASGSVHAILGGTDAARRDYQRSLELWRPLTGTKGFRNADMKDLKEAEAALARLSGKN